MKRVYELTADRIKETAHTTGFSFDRLVQIYNEALDRNCTVYVRVAPRWLQLVFVDNVTKHDLYIKDMLANHYMWETERIGGPNRA